MDKCSVVGPAGGQMEGLTHSTDNLLLEGLLLLNSSNADFNKGVNCLHGGHQWAEKYSAITLTPLFFKVDPHDDPFLLIMSFELTNWPTAVCIAFIVFFLQVITL